MLQPRFTSQYIRDAKRCQRKHYDMSLLREVIELIVDNSAESRLELLRRHNMHDLHGVWKGAKECHVANIGDWLLVWQVEGDCVVFLRTGSHDQIFK